MERLWVILLCFVLLGCAKESDEETFKKGKKNRTKTKFVASKAFNKIERIICLGVEQSDGSIDTTADVSSIKKKDVLSFEGSEEFLHVEEAPGNITMDKNCVYVERGYGDSAEESVKKGATASTVKSKEEEVK